MSPYTLAVTVHVVTAILGLGQVAGTAVLASSGLDAPVAPGTLIALRRLGRGTTWALAVMLLSGVLIEYACGGCYHTLWWFRVSVFLLVLLGALQGRIRRALRKIDPATDDGHPLRPIARMAWGMCTVVAVVAILMVVKPW
jgi:uncharacterized membrane protein